MGHTPYGYSIENGCATIKEDERITSPGWRWLRLLPLLA